MRPPGFPTLRAWRDKRGVAALELAAAAPVLFFLLMACVDFGRAVSQTMELNHAVRAGAQYAVSAPNSTRLIREAITNALPAHLSDAAIVTKCYCGALSVDGTDLPTEQASCDVACPVGTPRVMTLKASKSFVPQNFMFGRTLAIAVGFNQVVGDVTVRHQ